LHSPTSNRRLDSPSISKWLGTLRVGKNVQAFDHQCARRGEWHARDRILLAPVGPAIGRAKSYQAHERANEPKHQRCNGVRRAESQDGFRIRRDRVDFEREKYVVDRVKTGVAIVTGEIDAEQNERGESDAGHKKRAGGRLAWATPANCDRSR
jgi:hypothetical protein